MRCQHHPSVRQLRSLKPVRQRAYSSSGACPAFLHCLRHRRASCASKPFTARRAHTRVAWRVDNPAVRPPVSIQPPPAHSRWSHAVAKNETSEDEGERDLDTTSVNENDVDDRVVPPDLGRRYTDSSHEWIPERDGPFSPKNLLTKVKAFLLDEDSVCLRFDLVTKELQTILQDICTKLSLQYSLNENDVDLGAASAGHQELRKTARTPQYDPVGKSLVEAIFKDEKNVQHFQELTRAVRQEEGDVDRIPSFTDRAWDIIQAACRGLAAAVPSLVVTNLPLDDLSTEEEAPRSCRLELKCEAHDLSVTGVAHDRASLEATLQDMATQYAQTISQRIGTDLDDGPQFDFRTERGWGASQFLSSGASKLGWGRVSCPLYRLKFLTGDTTLELWECYVTSADHGLVGRPARWFSAKNARRLAYLSAAQDLRTHVNDAIAAGTLEPTQERIQSLFWLNTGSGSNPPADAPEDLSKPLILNIEFSTLAIMIRVLRQARQHGLPDEIVPRPIDWRFSHRYLINTRHAPHLTSSARPDATVHATPSQRGLTLSPPSNLPVTRPETRRKILSAIWHHNVVVIAAATGSGKTTQVPQLIVEQASTRQRSPRLNVICTQPRRISATSVARRVAHEMGSRVGERVGYVVRFDSHPPGSDRNTITYCTTRVLSQRLQADPFDTLSKYSHIIIDEVHVRDVHTDIILTSLREAFFQRRADQLPMPKIILMSATMNSHTLQHYFQESREGSGMRVARVDVPGRAFPVTEHLLDEVVAQLSTHYPGRTGSILARESGRHYLESQLPGHLAADVADRWMSSAPAEQADDKIPDGTAKPAEIHIPLHLVALTVAHLAARSDHGDILVFLPGLAEIDEVAMLLLEEGWPGFKLKDSDRFLLFKLHSALYETNDEVFAPIGPTQRRIILATNIAETAVTLPEVVYVVDSGIARTLYYDQSRGEGMFKTRWISKAEATQRRGRAGRVREGHYYALFSQKQYEEMVDAVDPEVQHCELTGIVLGISSHEPIYKVTSSHSLGTSPAWSPGLGLADDFLAKTVSPPNPTSVQAAITELQNIEALTADKLPTPLGKFLSGVPVHPALLKPVLMGILFNCFEPLLILASRVKDSSLVNHSKNRGPVAASRKLFAGSSEDDRFGDLQAFQEYKEARSKHDRDTMNLLRRERYVRSDVYVEMDLGIQQVLRLLQDLLHTKRKFAWTRAAVAPQAPTYLTDVACQLNHNASNTRLAKALALPSFGSRIAIWRNKSWTSPHFAKALVHPRSVNTSRNKPRASIQRASRPAGSLLAYGEMKNVEGDKYPWLVDTSTVDPMALILFGNRVELDGKDVIVVDGWIRIEIKHEDDSKNAVVDHPAMVAFEFRKALSRYLTLAFSDIAPVEYLRNRRRLEDEGERVGYGRPPHQHGNAQGPDLEWRRVRLGQWLGHNKIFKDLNHPLRKMFADALNEIFEPFDPELEVGESDTATHFAESAATAAAQETDTPESTSASESESKSV